MADTRVALLCFALCLSSVCFAAAPKKNVAFRRPQPTVRAISRPSEQLPAPRAAYQDEGEAAEEISADSASATDDVAWRYRYHLGRRWFFVEPGHWLFWDGQFWQDAQPALPKTMPDGAVQRPGVMRRLLAAWPQVPSYREHHGWVGGFYSSGGGYGASDFGYGYGIPTYGPDPRIDRSVAERKSGGIPR